MKNPFRGLLTLALLGVAVLFVTAPTFGASGPPNQVGDYDYLKSAVMEPMVLPAEASAMHMNAMPQMLSANPEIRGLLSEAYKPEGTHPPKYYRLGESTPLGLVSTPPRFAFAALSEFPGVNFGKNVMASSVWDDGRPDNPRRTGTYLKT
jgi:hypothetical protein